MTMSNKYRVAAYVSQKVYGELLIKKKNIYVDNQTAMAHVILQLHVMTGCDHSCGFYGHGKKNSHKKSYENLRSKSSVT